MAVVLGAILVVGWLALVYVIEPGVCVAGDRAAPDHRGLAAAAAAPTGRRARPRRSTSPGPTRRRWPRTTRRRRATSRSRRSQQTPGAMLDAVAEAGQSLAEVDLGAVMPSGGPVASGKRASKLGTGRAGPGLRARRRRRRRANSAGASSTTRARTAEEYARAARCPGRRAGRRRPGPTSSYTSPISRARRRPSDSAPGGDHRLYFLWQGRGRKESDLALFKKAGDRGRRDRVPVLSQEAEQRLAELEVSYKGRQPGEIRVTRFQVVPGRATIRWLQEAQR